MKKKLSTIAIALVFLLGAGLLLYPTVSDSINALHQSRAIAAYADAVEELDAGAARRFWRRPRRITRRWRARPSGMR